eukprot:TRINITY_DN9223_c0_g1_i2.p1 TRINITY_DN9223_c0_g1~~TRINITY_DN9223_c0_g1_i2.p1  ORF type:complete len:976 (+),score=233.60 TRINITY_DN9223_c0_g1_i2:222-3149(+)
MAAAAAMAAATEWASAKISLGLGWGTNSPRRRGSGTPAGSAPGRDATAPAVGGAALVAAAPSSSPSVSSLAAAAGSSGGDPEQWRIEESPHASASFGEWHRCSAGATFVTEASSSASTPPPPSTPPATPPLVASQILLPPPALPLLGKQDCGGYSQPSFKAAAQGPPEALQAAAGPTAFADAALAGATEEDSEAEPEPLGQVAAKEQHLPAASANESENGSASTAKPRLMPTDARAATDSPVAATSPAPAVAAPATPAAAATSPASADDAGAAARLSEKAAEGVTDLGAETDQASCGAAAGDTAEGDAAANEKTKSAPPEAECVEVVVAQPAATSKEPGHEEEAEEAGGTAAFHGSSTEAEATTPLSAGADVDAATSSVFGTPALEPEASTATSETPEAEDAWPARGRADTDSKWQEVSVPEDVEASGDADAKDNCTSKAVPEPTQCSAPVEEPPMCARHRALIEDSPMIVPAIPPALDLPPMPAEFVMTMESSESPFGSLGIPRRQRREKFIFLVRHAQSTWNRDVDKVKTLGSWARGGEVSPFENVSLSDFLSGTVELLREKMWNTDHPVSCEGARQAEGLRQKVLAAGGSLPSQPSVPSRSSTAGPTSQSSRERGAGGVELELQRVRRFYEMFLERRPFVYSSPLLRALQTAHLALPQDDGWGRIKLLKDAREWFRYLVERDCVGNEVGDGIVCRAMQAGHDLSGLDSRVDVTDCEERWWSEDPETTPEVEARLASLWNRLLEGDDHDSCVLVTHSNLIMALLRRIAPKAKALQSAADRLAPDATPGGVGHRCESAPAVVSCVEDGPREAKAQPSAFGQTSSAAAADNDEEAVLERSSSTGSASWEARPGDESWTVVGDGCETLQRVKDHRLMNCGVLGIRCVLREDFEEYRDGGDESARHCGERGGMQSALAPRPLMRCRTEPMNPLSAMSGADGPNGLAGEGARGVVPAISASPWVAQDALLMFGTTLVS